MRHKLTAKFPGTCASTGRKIMPGDLITYDTRTRRAYLDADPAATLAKLHAPDMTARQAHEAGQHLKAAAARWVSDYWKTGSREFYRNKAGRCEDAPACGCCNT